MIVFRTRKKLSSGIKNELEAFRETWRFGNPLFWDPRETAEQETFREQWQRLWEMPVELYVEKMLTATLKVQLSMREQPQKMNLKALEDRAQDMNLETLAAQMAWLEEAHPVTVPFYRELLRDAEGNRNRFANLLGAYWESGPNPSCIWPPPTSLGRSC